MREDTPGVVLTQRFADAVAYASWLHRAQSRKDTAIPYISHLLGTAANLLDQPDVTEDMAIAALLHDALEDCPDETSPEAIAGRFGPDVARIVVACSDTQEHPKPPWRHRKADYLAHLRHAPADVLKVSLADKLHNARAIADDLAEVGEEVWTRFNAPPVAQRWYYTELASVFRRGLPDNPVAATLTRVVEGFCTSLPSDVSLPAGVDRPAWVGADALTGTAEAPAAAGRRIARSTRHDGDPAELLAEVDTDVWASRDGRWWVERADTGHPTDPYALFVAPPTVISALPAAPPQTRI